MEESHTAQLTNKTMPHNSDISHNFPIKSMSQNLSKKTVPHELLQMSCLIKCSLKIFFKSVKKKSLQRSSCITLMAGDKQNLSLQTCFKSNECKRTYNMIT